MTLAEILPSLGGMLHTRLEQGVWPENTTSTPDGDLVVGGAQLSVLADRFGTPLDVLDEAELRSRCRDYRNALPDAEILPACDRFAGSVHVIRCLAEEGMALAVGSGRDAALARAAGVPARHVFAVDGVAQALAHGCGRVTVGSKRDVRLVARIADGQQDVLVDVAQRRARRGGASPVRIDYDRAMTVVRRLLAEESLRFAGLRCAIGPGTADVPEFEAVVRRLVRLMIEMRDTYGVATRELGIAAEHRAAEFDLCGFATRVRVALGQECARNRLRPPRLLVEPGRAFTARAGVAVRRVVAVAAGRLVVVDGPAGGGQARLVGRTSGAAMRALAVVGRDGSVLHGAVLPDDVRAGDLLAIPGADAPGRVPLVSVSEAEGTRDDVVSAR